MENIELKRPELMAPAGDMISLRAALDSGADAVYFGIVSMNMRANAKNFAVEDLPTVAELCHEYKAKAYLALNTIIFDHEVELAENLINKAEKAGVDGIICWDFSVVELALKYKMKILLSTQMSVANAHSMAFLYKSFGICRFVLARECTLEEISSIRTNLKKLLGEESSKIEIEVFAHGAMCVSVSGRCFMSQFAFNESANRGECRQPCRREYLIKDIREGKEFLIGQNYVMSPKDLCSLPFLEKLLDVGVDSLKIEGRGRSAEYVSVVTKAYRDFIDFYMENRSKDEFSERLESLRKNLIEKVDSVFHRGFSDGFFFGRQIGEWSGGNGSKASHRKTHVGVVTNFFKKVSVAEIKVEGRDFKVGDELMFQGQTTGVKTLKVLSIEENEKAVDIARKGSVVGVKLSEIVRENDQVFMIVPVEEVKHLKQN